MTSGTTDEPLRRLLNEGLARAAATDPKQARLWDREVPGTEGGKRFRPDLVAATHDALGGSRSAATVEEGAAIELLHTSFVIHDDVIEGDHLRRGRLNASGTFDAHAMASGAAPDDAGDFGRTAGILAGDLALAAATRAVTACGAAPEVTNRLLDLFYAVLHTTAAAELADVLLSLALGTVSLPASLAMEEQKSSAYSFALPLQPWALLAGADDRTVGRLTEAGRLLGIAFELVDDIGVFGGSTRTGKSTTNDLRIRKQTPLLAHATTTPESEQAHPCVGRDLTDDELTETRRLLTASSFRPFVEELADAHVSTARAVIAQLGISAGLLADVTTHPPVLAESNEVAA